ncbi:polysialyltransferase family glycosyltransferase [Caldicellulosiruptor morganii]|uniref:Alpha-2,8-polysialyltransferase family protein n=1 Tax=Caldicellulosiruptor morganii TaxID=1387555 RepID=A0ABY7BLE5_9FIRM|nr:polysialyltransferase family glycosyltransferase [Caldicellulosiruptor morganii]WAM33320.1 alpha-2,8-polysialyltransferase family protein [Caldicellulosiruptor morganii]
MKLLFVFSNHPAGVEFFRGIYKEKDKIPASITTGTTSAVIERLFLEDGIEAQRFDTEEQLVEFIRDSKPHVVMVDGAVNATCHRVTETAKQLGLITVGMLDFFGGYRKRFAVEPDYIIVPNEYIRQEMLQEGFQEEKLLPFGNPFFEEMLTYTPVFRTEFEKYIEKGKKNILFVSQCFKEDGYGITQEEIFAKYILSRADSNTNIIVKPHPREDASWVSKYPVKVFSEAKNSYVYDFINYCDLVVGVNSTLLYVCYIRGIPFEPVKVEGLLEIDYTNPLIKPYRQPVEKIIKFLQKVLEK